MEKLSKLFRTGVEEFMKDMKLKAGLETPADEEIDEIVDEYKVKQNNFNSQNNSHLKGTLADIESDEDQNSKEESDSELANKRGHGRKGHTESDFEKQD